MDRTRKIIPFDEIAVWCERVRDAGQKIVLTNGCFDILHAGHVAYLDEAAALGNKLVVGVNSDRSTRALKGPDRPVHREDDRAIVLAALACVDAVTIFDQDDARELIAAVRPHVHVKGGDYTMDSINQHESRLVEASGGEVRILNHVPGVSTSRILDSISKSGINS